MQTEKRKDVKLQTSLKTETSCQVSGSSMELFRGNQTGSTPVQSLKISSINQSETQ